MLKSKANKKINAFAVAALLIAITLSVIAFPETAEAVSASSSYAEKIQEYAYGDSSYAKYYPPALDTYIASSSSEHLYAWKFYDDFYANSSQKFAIKGYSDGFVRAIYKAGVANTFIASQHNGKLIDGGRTTNESASIRFRDIGLEFKAVYNGKSCEFRIKTGTLDEVASGIVSAFGYSYWAPSTDGETDGSGNLLLDAYSLITVKYETILNKMVQAYNAQNPGSYITADSVMKSGKKITLTVNALLTIVDPSYGSCDYFSLSSPEIIGTVTESGYSVTNTRRISSSNKKSSNVWDATANYVPVIANGYRGDYREFRGVTFTYDRTKEYSNIDSILYKIYDADSWGNTTSRQLATQGMYFNAVANLVQPPTIYYVNGSSETYTENGMVIPGSGSWLPSQSATFRAYNGELTTLEQVKLTCLDTGQYWTSSGSYLSINNLPQGEHRYKIEATAYANDNYSTKYKTEKTIVIRVVPAYTVSFDACGGLIPANGNMGNPTIQNQYGSTLNSARTAGTVKVTYATGSFSSMPSDCPTRAGYTFTGWYTQRSGGEKVYDSSGIFVAGTYWDSGGNWQYSGGLQLYAQWTPNNYTVTFDPNGGKTSVASKTVTFDSTYGNIPTPTRTGYSFVGWYTAKSGGSNVTSSTRVTTPSNHTLYAHWEAISVQVNFDANGGYVAQTSKTVQYDSPYGDLPVPSRIDFEFAGWYTKTKKGEVVTKNTIVKESDTHTLYAHWIPLYDILINDYDDLTGVTFGLEKYMTLGGTVLNYTDSCVLDGKNTKGLATTFTTMPAKGHYVKAFISLLGDTYAVTWEDGQKVTSTEQVGRVVIPGKLRGVHRNVSMELVVESYNDASCTTMVSRDTKTCLVNTDTVAPDITCNYNSYSKKAVISVSDQIVGVKSATYDVIFGSGNGSVYAQPFTRSTIITVPSKGKVVVAAEDLLGNKSSKTFDLEPATYEESTPSDPDKDPGDLSRFPDGTKYWKTRHFYCYLINGNS